MPSDLMFDGRRLCFGWAAVGDATTDALTPRERELAGRARSPKRRDEFIAGRVAAHRAIDGACLGKPFVCDVLAQAEGIDAGRPVPHPPRGIAISISHSGGWAVAVAAAGEPLGIDLEAIDLEADASFENEAFAPGELAGWRGLADMWASPPSIAWAAKEAVLKVWGIGLRAPLAQVSVRPQGWAGEMHQAFTLRVDHSAGLAFPRPDWFSACAWRMEDRVLVVAQRSRQRA